jgi:hypothetical protein
MKEGKRERLSLESKNRYNQFREQFDDIFEVTLSQKQEKEVQQEVAEFKKMKQDVNDKAL